MAKMAKKKLPLDIPIMMLNHQKNWIEVNLGAPEPGMTIFSIFQPQKRGGPKRAKMAKKNFTSRYSLYDAKSPKKLD